MKNLDTGEERPRGWGAKLLNMSLTDGFRADVIYTYIYIYVLNILYYMIYIYMIYIYIYMI